MKKIILFSIFVLLSSKLYAEEEIYSVQRDDGGVSIVHYNPASKDSLEDVLRESGLDGLFARKISASDLPASKADREFWKASGKKVVVDQAKKQQSEAEKSQKEIEKQAVLAKLKISKNEADALLGAKNG